MYMGNVFLNAKTRFYKKKSKSLFTNRRLLKVVLPRVEESPYSPAQAFG